jgi:hypothetical protein
MKRAFSKLILAGSMLFGLFAAATPDCHAWDGYGSCSPCCCWPNDWHVVDCYTRCAWRRTWYGPNALATPLREYYVPRPPACCWCGDHMDGVRGGRDYFVGGSYAMANCANCEDRNVAMGSEISPEAAAGFSPAQFERLGKVRNELDVVGPIGAPASGRAAAPAK